MCEKQQGLNEENKTTLLKAWIDSRNNFTKGIHLSSLFMLCSFLIFSVISDNNSVLSIVVISLLTASMTLSIWVYHLNSSYVGKIIDGEHKNNNFINIVSNVSCYAFLAGAILIIGCITLELQ